MPECAPPRIGACRQCNGPLNMRRTVFCKTECYKRWQANHYWPTARRVTVRRARKLGPGRKYSYECAICKALFRYKEIEVDHIQPRRGDRSKVSCLHHLDNLRVLCSPCHKMWTAEQHARGMLKSA